MRLNVLWLHYHKHVGNFFLFFIFLQGMELRFGRSPVPFIMASGNMENVMDMVPTACYSQKQRNMQRSTLVDGKMERSM